MKHIFLFFAIVSILSASSCKKCDDLSPSDCKDCYEKLAGDWTLNYLATNGIDSVGYYNTLFGSKCIMSFQVFTPTDSYQPGYKILWGDTSDTSGNYFFFGERYYGITNDSYLSIYFETSGVLNPFSGWYAKDYENEWKITRLSGSDLWFQFERNNLVYEMHLSK